MTSCADLHHCTGGRRARTGCSGARAGSRDARAAHRAHGFTLIELVIAGTIAAMLLGAVTLALSQLGKTRNIARDRVEAFQRATTAMETVRREVVATLRSDDLFDSRFMLTTRSGNARTGGYDRSELLIFNTSLRPTHPIDYQGEGTEYEVALRVEEDDLGSALWRRRDPVPDEVPDGGGMAEPIADGIIGLQIEASDGEGGWNPEWDSDYDGIPKLVRITVTADGTPVGKDPDSTTPQITLQTMVAIDRVIAPKPDEPPPEEAAGAAGGGAGEAAAGGGADTAGQPAGGGLTPGGGGARPGGGGAGGAGGTPGGGQGFPAGGPGAGGGGGGRGPGGGGGARPGGGGGAVGGARPAPGGGPRGGGR